MFEENFLTDDYESYRKIQYKFPMIFKACSKLEPYVSCYWYAAFNGTENERKLLKPKKTILIPDGGAGFVFNVNPAENWENALVWGVMDSPIEVYNQQSTSRGRIRTFGVDFKPAGLYRFFNIPMTKLKNTTLMLEEISIKHFGEICNRIHNAKSVGELINIMEIFLLRRLQLSNKIHDVVAEALNVIKVNTGNIRISELSKELIISERSLNRLFHEYVGMSPKLLCRITRLQRVIKICKEDAHKEYLMSAYDTGYFDQSHFIKDFKEFCGCTPSEYLLKR